MLNILSVEDDHVIAKCIKQYFEEICGNYQVTSIDHGDLAFDTLSNPHSFDCIILDLTLPGKSGLEILQALRHWDKTTPVIICTAIDFNEKKQACREAGANEVVGKPFNITELHELVTKLSKEKMTAN